MDRIPDPQQYDNPLDNILGYPLLRAVSDMMDAELRRIRRELFKCDTCLYESMELKKCLAGECAGWTPIRSNSICFDCNERNCQKEGHECR
jgi:hypothetical protein